MDKDYELRKISELRNQGGTSNKNVYMLTSKSFFIALMRAQKHSKHNIDPTIYAEYFQFIQKVFLYYSEYELKHEMIRSKRIIGEKDDKLDNMSKQIAELLGYAKETKHDNEELNAKLDETNESLEEVKTDLQQTKQEVRIVADHLINKSLTSTMNPIDEGLKHHALMHD